MKSSFLVSETVKQLISSSPRSCGFLTLTFSSDVTPAEASRRFNSFRTNVLSKISDGFVSVIEAHSSGRPHFHLVLRFKNFRFQESFPFGDVKRGVYYRVAKETRRLWAYFREILLAYGFGRAQLLPAVPQSAQYIAKYLVKGSRPEGWTGVRMYRISRGIAAGSRLFSWVSPFGNALRIAYASIYSSLPPSRTYYRFHFYNRSAACKIARDLIYLGFTELVEVVPPSSVEPPSFKRN